MSKENTQGICALCLNENELKKSHIYPRHFYKSSGLLGKKKKIIYSLRMDEKLSEKIDDVNFDGDKEYLLCKDCEQYLNFNYERYSAENFINKNAAFYNSKKLEYPKIKLYILSILWRCSISKKYSSGCILNDSVKEKLRSMILNNDPENQMNFP